MHTNDYLRRYIEIPQIAPHEIFGFEKYRLFCIYEIHEKYKKSQYQYLCWLEFCTKKSQKIGGYDENIFQLGTHDPTPLFGVGSAFFGCAHGLRPQKQIKAQNPKEF